MLVFMPQKPVCQQAGTKAQKLNKLFFMRYSDLVLWWLDFFDINAY